MTSKALIFANGDIDDGPMVQRALSEAVSSLVIAADGGANVAQHFGMHIDLVVGDIDSLTNADLRKLTSAGAEVLRHSPEKDFTDLELALTVASERGVNWVRIIGGVGNRLDQTLANIYLLALPVLKGHDVRLVAGRQQAFLLRSGTTTIEGKPGDTISLIPLGGAVHGIRTESLFYPLEGETLEFGPARGISNVMDADKATITMAAGVLLIVHTEGRA